MRFLVRLIVCFCRASRKRRPKKRSWTEVKVNNSLIGHFRVPPGLCFKTRVGAQPLIWKSHFILTQVKLIFHKKGCAPGLILKVKVFETRKWPIRLRVVPIFFLRDGRTSETQARVKITPHEKSETRDFHACSRFARSTIPEEIWGLLVVYSLIEKKC